MVLRDRWRQPPQATRGSGSQARTAPGARAALTVVSVHPPSGQGWARVAAVVRTVSRPPGPSLRSIVTVSPSRSPAAAPMSTSSGPLVVLRILAATGGRVSSPTTRSPATTTVTPPLTGQPSPGAASVESPKRAITVRFGLSPPPSQVALDEGGHRAGTVLADERGEQRGPLAPLGGRVPRHHPEVGAHHRRQVDLVDDQQVRAGDARPSLTGDLVAAGHVDDEELEVGEGRAERGGQVVPARLDEQQLQAREPPAQLVDRLQVAGDVVPDGGMRAAASLDRHHPLRRHHPEAEQRLGILPRVDVVGDHRSVEAPGEEAAQGGDQRCLPGPHRAADAHPERADAVERAVRRQRGAPFPARATRRGARPAARAAGPRPPVPRTAPAWRTGSPPRRPGRPAARASPPLPWRRPRPAAATLAWRRPHRRAGRPRGAGQHPTGT